MTVAHCSDEPEIEASGFREIDAAPRDEAGNLVVEDSGPTFGQVEASADAKKCTGLECYQGTCPGDGGTTSASGVVYAPEGTIPLYNAIVYVPNSTPEPFKNEVVCEQCGKVSGNP